MSTKAAERAAVVGVGSTPYYRRGQSAPQTLIELACKAMLAAVDDAGLSIEDVDGLAYYSGGFDTALIAQTLGIPEIRFTATLTGGGGGSAASVGLAASAVTSGLAEVVVSLMTIQQVQKRFGTALAPTKGVSGVYATAANEITDFFVPSGLFAPGQAFSLITRRHMHRYGTTREHFAEVVLSTRANAVRRPTALQREPLTLDDYFNARMISEPLCLLDYCLETDGAVAVVTTSLERARDLRQRPVVVAGSAQGGMGRWGQAIRFWQMPDEYFASSGHRGVAKRLYAAAGVGPQDVDVAELYDHFSPMVIMQLEDYGFCPEGQGGPFVAEGNIRWPDGSLPVNTHGGNLSEAYIIGMTHVREAVEQLRGTAVNQVPDAEVALVTGGPAAIPVSGLILVRE
jgi:acetyl-CoA acetyltransferase